MVSEGTLAEWDVQYSLDNLGRVLRAKEGKLASGAVADADRDRDERWQNTSGNGALSPTGNWDRRRLDLNGGVARKHPRFVARKSALCTDRGHP